jgi:hypothetical protein
VSRFVTPRRPKSCTRTVEFVEVSDTIVLRQD